MNKISLQKARLNRAKFRKSLKKSIRKRQNLFGYFMDQKDWINSKSSND
jgi:hypothetical protein